jgi:hypothetical protein
MANVKVTQDKNGVRWLELMRNGSGTLLEIRNKEEALQIITALQQSVQSDGACTHANLEAYEFGYYCKDCGMANPPRR